MARPLVAPLSTREERCLERVEESMPEMVAFLQELVRIPTVNPPGENYAACAEAFGDRYRALGYEVRYIAAEGHPDHSAAHPRVNVMARREGRPGGPCVHFNGHLDVVPPGNGWSVDPFAGVERGGRIYGRGTCDMKGGMVASLYAMEAVRRAGVVLGGAVEQSATVDEESGGFAGVAYLADRGHLSAAKQQHVIITEPLNPDRVCLGHRGVYWFDVTLHGRTAHGGMPFLGENAIDRMNAFLSALRERVYPGLEGRVTALPVVPPGARRATLNLNSIAGGQPIGAPQSPCVPDRCTAVFDRRFLPEESLAEIKAEIAALLGELGGAFELVDRMVVEPVFTAPDAPVVLALKAAVERLYGRPAELVASPGTYDQKHMTRRAGIAHCVAYGPGILDLAHQPDEYVAIADLELSAKAMALAALRLLPPA